jgi:RNA polymerase sigma-70 factor (ECF subfamily)
MARYADGDVDGFDELFRRYEARIHAYFFRRTGSAERAQDLYQELFLRIHRARHDYDRTRAFAPWLFQIAHRLLVDDQRRAHRSHEVPIDDPERLSCPARSEELLASRERLDHVFDALSDDERYVLVAAKLEGIGYPDLASRLGKSVDAVKKMASRASQRLRAANGPARQAALHHR